MPTYILLRNNKETGPLTFEELIGKGLKAYDLIWIEGRSAGWRYPSEIEELKAYAPVVEEQPFDRFYKKNTASSANQLSVSGNPTSSEMVVSQAFNQNPGRSTPAPEFTTAMPFSTSHQPPTSSSKRIYVTIPNQNKIKQPTEVRPTPVENNTIPATAQPAINKDSEPSLEEKFSQPLDAIKKMYVDSLLQKKNRNQSFPIIPDKLKLVAVALLLLIAGASVGYYLKQQKTITPPSHAASVPEQKVINTAVQEKDPLFEPTPQNNTVSFNNVVPVIPEKHTTTVISNNNNIPLIPKNSETNNGINTKPIKNSPSEVKREIKEATVTPTVKETEQTITLKPKPTVNLAKEITIIINDYKRATFGGISNVEFSLRNQSNYTINTVAAIVEYYTANQKLYKTETIYFNNIPPNGTQVQKAPDSKRGYEVKYHISLISSKDLGLYTAGN